MSLGTEKQRARTDDEKDARRRSLIAAARAMLENATPEEIRIADVARSAGLAKGTAYLYFSSKEALFLAVLADALDQWFAEAAAAFEAPGTRDPAERIAEVMAASMAREPVVLSLLVTLHTRLEANASAAEIATFKRALMGRLQQTGAAVDRLLGWPEGRGVHFFLRAHALAIGMAQIADPPERVRAVVEGDPAFSPFLVEFEAEFRSGLLAFLRAPA